MSKIDSVRLIFFSPTGTTRRVIEGIAEGTGAPTVEHLDLTPPDSEISGSAEMSGGLAVIGSPVYTGRVPAEAALRLRRARGNGTPAVVVVVYGNRAYEDALLELRDLALEAGFIPVAAGAFIGEHSFSSESTPIAAGRPDPEDLAKAREFGEIVREKLKTAPPPDRNHRLFVPGNFPYKERGSLPELSPVTKESLCEKCQECASACPTAAITVADAVTTDAGLCIKCCACVKTCSTGARTMEDTRIKQAAGKLSVNCAVRKEPETYIWPALFTKAATV
ncbi:MAG: 4Fe-4S binding protein [Candidatus Sulfobium sp.]|jgi:ferredoxin